MRSENGTTRSSRCSARMTVVPRSCTKRDSVARTSSAAVGSSAEDVLATLSRLVHDLGTTVILAEHRLERVVPFSDRMIYLHGDGTVEDGLPEEILKTASVAPPIVELGRLAGWDPLAMSVREARRKAAPLRA